MEMRRTVEWKCKRKLEVLIRYTEGVEAISQMNSGRVLRYVVGAMLCGLLLVYALGAKLALYHTGQPGARSVAATKAWQDHAPSAEIEVAPVLATPSVMEAVAALLSLVFVAVWYVAEDKPVMAVVHGFSPHLSVRPPPSI